MYLTVQKVLTPSGQIGTNAYVYAHESDISIDWDHPDVEQIATRLPGKRVEAAVEVAPGGNSVISFLDVVAKDGTPHEEIRQALDLMGAQVDRRASMLISGPVSIRFNTSFANAPNARLEFLHLRGRLLEVLGRHVPWQRQSPLSICERRVDTGRVFELDDVSAGRVASRRTGWQQLPLHISDEVTEEFEQIHGSIRGHVAELITGLSNDEILALGGYRILDEAGHEQMHWPELLTADDISETIVGQISGYWFGPLDEIPSQREGHPTGAVLAQAGQTIYTAPCLDLVWVNYLWVPLSTAGAYTYRHTAGLINGEGWRFVLADEPWPTIASAELVVPLPPSQIRTHFGVDAYSRARHDHEAVQLRLRRDHG